ncbi:hypothetical protein [Halorubrum sp. GN11GM_10-3_MGM]|uniref:hypothetical protein n=1 Tax=Halorubrum sp. GN11GM_10-3_MGM TaxID=2518111 RepID=UPI0010FA0A49|nr:hypothetical protein [Halorubrum sp. GN11GM_10-3_MGM]TKX70953.1 hypothetical protein EXE40_08635 [Halorubrum sp. GN11GM_10-3_MGM]
MTGISSGGGGGYDYVQASYPPDAEEGEDLYHLTEDAAFVYSGSAWIEQTVTDHSQLSGVNEGDHRSDSQVKNLAPVDTVNGRSGDVSGLLEASDYTPEADTHSRPTGTDQGGFETVTIQIDGSLVSGGNLFVLADSFELRRTSDQVTYPTVTDSNGNEYEADDTTPTVSESFAEPTMLIDFNLEVVENELEIDVIVDENHAHGI